MMSSRPPYSVLKFGGSSVANATNISRVLDIVGGPLSKGERVVLICSAISGCTDGLLTLGDPKAEAQKKASVQKNLLDRHLAIARRLFTGAERMEAELQVQRLFDEMDAAPDSEKVTFGELLSTTLIALKLRCDGYRTLWLDSRELVIADDLGETYCRIEKAIREGEAEIFVAPGFIARNRDGAVTTLGRGGSDYSAALYAAAIRADSLQIWTDVPGIMTANPKDVKAARTVPNMPYQAALDMARCGAKVLYAPTVAPAMEAGIAIEIKNTFDPANPGTRIEGHAGAFRLIGVASEKDGDRVILTLVASGKGDEAADVLPRMLEMLRLQGIQPAGPEDCEEGPEGILFRVPLRPKLEKRALEVLHCGFFETTPRQSVDLYLAGKGAVGKALVKMIEEAGASILERTGKLLRIVDIADSSRPDFVDTILAARPQGAVFIDATDSDSLYMRYVELLEEGISIVSSNRHSFAVPYVDYAAMHDAAMRSGTTLRYETTVGAALPVLSSIAQSANSSDEILSIEAVVSCTLNRILGDYNGEDGHSFARLLRQAQQDGLTEHDPRVDLSGRDALRKLLILAREAGVPLEAEDVAIEPVVPLPEGSLEDFYAQLEAMEPLLKARVNEAAAKGCRLRFVASLEKDPRQRLGFRAGIRVCEVGGSHPAYHLRGTENAIILQSAFHPYPLVIQGAGEGARQAASSILNDILK